MDFSFSLDGAAMTGNISPETMTSMSALFGTLFGGMVMIWSIIWVAVVVLMLISRRKIFKKAGLPGRGILIPVYNIILMFKLGGMSGRWALSVLFPPLLLVMIIINIFKITEKFGKHWAFGLGILFIKIVFVPILAFDGSKYLGKKATKSVAKTIAKPVAKAPAKKVIKKKAPAKKVVKKVKMLGKKK